jgi:PAS domain S-box-containing protein
MLPIDFRRLFELSPNPYMLLDRDLRYVAANAAYRQVTASSLDDLLGRHVLEAFPHDPDNPTNENATLLVRSLERVIATGRADTLAHIVYRVRRVAGGPLEERVWSATHTPIPDEHGRVTFVLQHTEDVTELHHLRRAVTQSVGDPRHDRLEAGVLRRAEDVQSTNLELDAQRQHLLRLFEQAPGFVCVLKGPTHVLELANSAYYQLIGDRSVIGKPIREALPDIEGQGYFERLDAVYATGQAFVGRAMSILLRRHESADVEEAIVDFVYQPIVGHDGRVSGIFVQGHDITGQKRLEEELAALLERERAARADAESARAQAERANVLKDEFVATLSHELRTPLNALLGWTRLLRSDQLGPEMAAKAAETIERNATLQAQLVEDVLDVSRIVTGKLRLQVQDCDLSDVVRRAVDVVAPAAAARTVALLPGPLECAVLRGDPDRLQQVVWNLLSNAVKFTPAGGSVHIDVASSDLSVCLTVRDTGRGIDAAFLPLVFQRFRQSDPGFDRQQGGLGLGLALVRHIIESHGGEVTAESPGIDQGAVFTVRLPRHAAAMPLQTAAAAEIRPAAPVVPATGSLDGIGVLVVEDNPDALDLMAHLLTAAGASVRTATTAGEALQAVWQEPPDVLVSDLGLPGMDGLEMVRCLRRDPRPACRDVPAIAVTAYARPSDRAQALDAGFQVHLAKPISAPDLISAIGTLARRLP